MTIVIPTRSNKAFKGKTISSVEADVHKELQLAHFQVHLAIHLPQTPHLDVWVQMDLR